MEKPREYTIQRIFVICAIIGTAFSLLSVIIALLSYLQSIKNKDDIQVLAAASNLDKSLGSENWFIYPDDNFSSIGVKRLPKGFIIEPFVKTVETSNGIYSKNGERIDDNNGAHIDLKTALRKHDIPDWQKKAIDEWKAAKLIDTIGITSQRLDSILGKGNWIKDERYKFLARVNRLPKDLPIEFPITNVDADNLKYGVGMKPVKAGLSALVWFAGEIRDSKDN